MTFIDTSFISDAVQTVLFKPQRAISYTIPGSRQIPLANYNSTPATIIADVTIEEECHDELQITEHPVEGTGSGTTFISDHAFKRPVELVVRMGFTNSQISSLLSGGVIGDINSITANGISANNSVAQYDRLRFVQDNRLLCKIVTGKRTYTNMLLQSLSVVNDVRTENALIATCRWRQIIFVSTSLVQVVTPDQHTGSVTIMGKSQLASGSNINTSDAAATVQADIANDAGTTAPAVTINPGQSGASGSY